MTFRLSSIGEAGRIISEAEQPDFKSAVAIVRYNDRWLLGLARNSGDRNGKWCHPGGGIKNGEKPEKAAERECYEELGIKCKASGKPFRIKDHIGVAFVPCRLEDTNYKIDVNKEKEFSGAGFFTMAEIRNLKPLYKNVIQLIEKARDS